MLDGRQIAVVAHALSGDHDAALTLVRNTAPGQPWEQAVTACLALTCHPAPDTDLRRAALSSYLALNPALAGLAVFHTRLGLALLDAVDDASLPEVNCVAVGLLHLATGDGYAARDLADHDFCQRQATEREQHDVAAVVAACGLDTGRIPEDLLIALRGALDTAEDVLAASAMAQRP